MASCAKKRRSSSVEQVGEVVESKLMAFRSSLSLQDAVDARFTERSSRCLQEMLENIARGEMLRLLPINVQAHIFSYISVNERVRVLETISGGEAAGQRTQANFRRAVLESYKSVRTLSELGPKYTKLKYLQTTGEQLEGLKRRFPKLRVEIDDSELQGFIFASHGDPFVVQFSHLCDHGTFNQITWEQDFPFESSKDIFAVNSTSVLIINANTERQTVFLLNVIDFSVRSCAALLHVHEGGDALMVSGFVYVVGGILNSDRICDRYNLESDSWERIADLNEGHLLFTLVEWNEFLYAVGGLASDGFVERYDPEKNTWEVVFQENALDEEVSVAVVVDDVLYCCTLPEDQPCSFWKFDIRTGTNLGRIVGVSYEVTYPFVNQLYVKNHNVCLLVQKMDDTSSNSQMCWKTYVLDQTESTWGLLDSGALQWTSQMVDDWLRVVVPIFL